MPYHLWKSPQPFGFEPFSDLNCLITFGNWNRSRHSLSASSPFRTFPSGQGFDQAGNQVARAFRHRALFGPTWTIRSPLKGAGRQSLSASSPFRTRTPWFHPRLALLVARAFRLRALFGLENIKSMLPTYWEGRQSLSASSPFRTSNRFPASRKGKKGSPEPFGFEPFSDSTGQPRLLGGTLWSPEPFGFEPFSDPFYF